MKPGQPFADLPARRRCVPTPERGNDGLWGERTEIAPTLRRGSAAFDAPASRHDGT